MKAARKCVHVARPRWALPCLTPLAFLSALLQVPSFGYINGKAEYCGAHKLPGMLHLKHPRCAFTGCTKVRVRVCPLPLRLRLRLKLRL